MRVCARCAARRALRLVRCCVAGSGRVQVGRLLACAEARGAVVLLAKGVQACPRA